MSVTAANQDDRTWGMIAHLSALAGYAIPLGNVIGPMIIWLAKRDTSAYVAQEAREALNFHITVTIAAAISALLILVLIGFVLLIAVGLVALIFTIIAGIKANEGNGYVYPFAVRLIH